MFSIDYILFSIYLQAKQQLWIFVMKSFLFSLFFKNSQILRQKLPVWLSFVKRNGDQESGVCGNL